MPASKKLLVKKPKRPPAKDSVSGAKNFLTSAEVASALAVGVSSVKRWTDLDLLESVRTVGGHRRYSLASVHTFAESQGLPTKNLPALNLATFKTVTGHEPDELFDLLLAALRDGKTGHVRGYLAQLLPEVVDSVDILDRLVGPVMRRLGTLWEKGKLGIEEEHRASYILAESIDRLRPESRSTGKMALLACPPGELHDLPLRMVRLVAESNGWRTEYLGANVPWRSIDKAIRKMKPDLVLMSSRLPDAFSTPGFREIVQLSSSKEIRLAVGGEWARGGRADRLAVPRFRTLLGFQRWLRAPSQST